MSKKNYIKLNRSILTHWIWPTGRAYTETEAWLWLLLKAAHSIHKGHSDKKILTIYVGEILTSTKELSDVFGWGWRRTKSFLENLKNDDMIDIADGTRYSIRVIIKNYAAFQGKNDDIGRADDIADSIPDDIACDELTTELTSLEVSQREGKDTLIIKGNKGKRIKYIIPADFSVTDEMRIWAEKTIGPVDWLDSETAEFVEYWQERGEKRPGWLLTWKKRIKAVAEYKQKRGQESRNSSGGYDWPDDPLLRGAK